MGCAQSFDISKDKEESVFTGGSQLNKSISEVISPRFMTSIAFESPRSVEEPQKLLLELMKKRAVSVDSPAQCESENAFSVNRLISCPDLTPSLRRSREDGVKTERFANVLEASLQTSTQHFNWAEHAPITPRSSFSKSK